MSNFRGGGGHAPTPPWTTPPPTHRSYQYPVATALSRLSTSRHTQSAGDLGLAVQFNAETLWHFVQLRYPRVG